MRRGRALSCGDTRVYREAEVRRVWCHNCGAVKQEKLPWVAANPFYPQRVAFFVGRRCRRATLQDGARALRLDWRTVKEVDKHSMREQLRRTGTPGPKLLGVDAIAMRKGHPYRIVGSALERQRALWCRGTDRSEASRDLFSAWLGTKKSKRIRLAVMDMWKPFCTSTRKAAPAPQAKSLFDNFHVLRHLHAALAQVRKSEYARLTGTQRQFSKGQQYLLLAHRANLTLAGRRALQQLLRANKRLHTAYLLQESFGQLGDYEKEGWARRFLEHWRAALKWQRLQPYEKFADLSERHWEGIAAYCHPENKVVLGFVEGLNNKIQVLQRRAYGLRDEEYLRLKILTCMLPEI